MYRSEQMFKGHYLFLSVGERSHEGAALNHIPKNKNTVVS